MSIPAGLAGAYLTSVVNAFTKGKIGRGLKWPLLVECGSDIYAAFLVDIDNEAKRVAAEDTAVVSVVFDNLTTQVRSVGNGWMVRIKESA